MGNPAPTTKVALVYDWLTNMGGAERELLSFHKIFPDAPIFTSVFEPDRCPPFAQLDVRTTYLQHLPKFLRWRHQLFPVFRAYAFRTLDLSAYDIVISITNAEAKAVRVRDNAVHICYCHTPTRYYWSHYQEYKKRPGFGMLDPLIRLLIPPFVAWMRRLDLRAVQGVDYFIANSHEVQRRVKKYYRRDATVIYPPVEVDRFRPKESLAKEDFYLIVGRQVPYKRMDLAVRACTQLGKKLVVIGRGSEHEKLVKLAGPTIEFPHDVDDQAIVGYFQHAKGFIFPAEEDFGIVPVEAMAAGTPVIAFGKGGATETVVEGKTGTFFAEQTVNSLVEAIHRFETMSFSAASIQKHAQQFSEEQFIQNIHQYIQEHSIKAS